MYFYMMLYGFYMDLLYMIADLLVYLLTSAPPSGGIFASLITHIQPEL